MYNYNRDVLNAEYERTNRITAAAGRQAPYHMRSGNWKRVRGWFAGHVVQPAGASVSALFNRVALQGGRYWRRSSSRAKGLLLNNIESLIPGRA